VKTPAKIVLAAALSAVGWFIGTELGEWNTQRVWDEMRAADAEPAITTTYDQCLAEVLAGEVICLVGVGDQVGTALIGEPTRAECEELANRGDTPKLCVVTEGPGRGATFPIADAQEAS
jgi:hypothetical protein